MAEVRDASPASTSKKAKKTSSIPRKAKSPTAKKPRAEPLHPSYLQMASEAIAALKDRSGSSQYAIAKHMESKYKAVLPPNFQKILSVQLKSLVKQGKLVKVKASFKLSEDLKKQVAPKKSKAKTTASEPGKPSKAEPKSRKVAPKKAMAAKKPKPAAKSASIASMPAVPAPASARKASAKKTAPKKKAVSKKSVAKTPTTKPVANNPTKKPTASKPTKPKAPGKPAASEPTQSKPTGKPAAKKPAKSLRSKDVPKAKKNPARKAKKS